jgi:prepilin-type N-terminal cleavage/methylation domain-containing protein
MPKLRNASIGFTLAELLIALVILGVIATFTIPKILTSQQSAKTNAAAKDAMAMVSGAYQLYVRNSGASSSMTMGDLTQYMNYVALDTSSLLDDHVGSNATYDCSTITCLRLHGGGTIFNNGNTKSFGGTATTNAILLYYDPDSIRTGSSADSVGKSVAFFLYYNGGMTSRAQMRPGTCDSSGCHATFTNADPSWFSW